VAKTKPSNPHITGPLAEYADGFRSHLARQGYTPLTTAGHLRLMAHLSKWLMGQCLGPWSLDEGTVRAYCSARRASGYTNELTPRALRPLLDHLRAVGAAPQPARPAPTTPVDELLVSYGEWLRLERGLKETTIDLNTRLVRPLLVSHVVRRGGRLTCKVLDPKTVADFVTAEARRRPGSAKRMVTSLRSVLGFLYLEGYTAQPLAAAVPSVPGWTLTGLPKALAEHEVDALLASCDRATPTGRRDLAILTLLARLGLRAGEVASLRLDDIDWRNGEVVVRGKAGRRDVLPLPEDVGEAIVAYLCDGRPDAAQGRTVFVYALAPYRALSTAGVTTVVATAARRAGLGTIHAHRLRHTVATVTLRKGGTLAEIGQLLRHRRASTTQIYVKVDLQSLRPLGRPWPGATP
jgi:integrase/recombinase XerD